MAVFTIGFQPVIHRLEERELLHLGAFSYEKKETAWQLSSVKTFLLLFRLCNVYSVNKDKDCFYLIIE